MSPDPTLDTNCILLAEAEGTTLFSHALPMLAAFSLFALLTACAVQPAQKEDDLPRNTAHAPFRAQVVGLQWLNPLQRLDYPTEWQLLWTLGLAKPNKNDDMVRTDPRGFSTLQAVAPLPTISMARKRSRAITINMCEN